MSLNSPVLVLNQNCQPLNVCDVRRAIALLGHGKAELMENGRGQIRSISQTFTIPSVIRLQHQVNRPLMRRRLSRRSVFYRDKYTCQYCGKETKSLTLDHVIPRSRGGPHVWQNVVGACIPCNPSKGRGDTSRGEHAVTGKTFGAPTRPILLIPPQDDL